MVVTSIQSPPKTTSAKKRSPRSAPVDRVAAAQLPEVILLGDSRRVASIDDVFKEMRVTRRRLAWTPNIEAFVTDNTLALILVAPLAKKPVPVWDALRRIRENEQTAPIPVIAILPNNATEQAVRKAYLASATAVFKWPRESENLPFILAEILGTAQVRGRSGNADRALGRTVRAHIRARNIHVDNLKVRVRDGGVTLSGSVRYLWQKHALRETAERIPGVVRVDARDLYVSYGGVSDRKLARSVEHVLAATTDIDNATIATQVRNGRVILAGSTTDKREYQRILDLLSHVNGVRGIDKFAVISKTRKKRDKSLTAQLEKTLAIAFPKVRVNVTVFGGAVVLRGKTDTLAKRRRIVETVELQEGVHRVVNKIEIRQ